MSRRTRTGVALAATLLLASLAACEGSPVASTAPEPLRLDTFVSAMAARGATVELREGISQPFMPVSGRIVTIAGEPLQLFEFPNPASARLVAAQISMDGTKIGTYQVFWAEPPHIFGQDQLIVLYVGEHGGPSHRTVLGHLEGVLGPQLAGH